MSGRPRLGLLGGSLDPIHYGHLDAAEAARTALALDEVIVIPSHDPPHRVDVPRASGFHRFAMTALALAGCDGYRLSDAELTRDGPSYTIDTLRGFHADGCRPSQLFFILGADAFAEIATWYRFPEVLDAAHFAVISRPGLSIEEALARTPALVPRARRDVPAGTGDERTWIVLVESSTRDVSSTGVRARLAAGEPIADLVPEPVARYIAVHHLYGAVETLHG